MKIALIGTYPPRKCGIGTFTNNLVKALEVNVDHQNTINTAMVLAINDGDSQYNYPQEVKKVIRANLQRDYSDAAEFINHSGARVCILQHEFGIFGGQDGVYILQLLHKLKIPLVVTFHTVLKAPSYTQRSIIEEIGKKAAGIVVMSKRAIEFLRDIYQIPSDKIVLIEHGVPEFEKLTPKEAKEKFALVGKKVLFTFGLLGRNKGIETVIHALPRVVKRFPNLLYIVLGATHPNVLKHSGEEYRNYLKRLVREYDLERNVSFNNDFASETTLFEYLNASDIYLSPYLSEAQITSGTLSYAIGAGCAVVSTPYWHAQELLDQNRGRLFEFKNSEELADVLLELLDDEEKLTTLRRNAFEYGRNLRWPEIGKQYLRFTDQILRKWVGKGEADLYSLEVSLLPKFDLEHVLRLTDDTGIVQHAKFGIPNLKEGYCLDDNSRALIMSIMAYRQNKDKEALRLMPVYLSFIHYMQRQNGNFRNFLSFSRQFLDEYGSDDSFGRTIWALGYLLRFPPNDSFKQIGREIFFKSVRYFDQIHSVRGAANSIIGICHYLKDVQDDEEMVNVLNRFVQIIVEAYNHHASEDWRWFEDKMTYDNAIIPLALFCSYEITGYDDVLKIALEAMQFLESKTFKEDYLIPVGNQGWLHNGSEMPEYDQQSLDVMAMVLLYYQMFQVLKEREYIRKLFRCHMWFLGENSLRLPLFDHETKGCCDGLQQEGLNRNQGAESTLAYWISHMIVMDALEMEQMFLKKNVFRKEERVNR